MLITSAKTSQASPDTNKKPDITYPCVWLYKVIGEDGTAITQAIKAVCPVTISISHSNTSSSGKYCSLNVEIEVADEATRLAIYQNLKNHFAIKMVL
jgi:putative lipoic acid-binding regulatory protein